MSSKEEFLKRQLQIIQKPSSGKFQSCEYPPFQKGAFIGKGSEGSAYKIIQDIYPNEMVVKIADVNPKYGDLWKSCDQTFDRVDMRGVTTHYENVFSCDRKDPHTEYMIGTVASNLGDYFVQIYDYTICDNKLYIFMEKIDGTIDELLRDIEHEKDYVAIVDDIVMQILEALVLLEQEGIMHNDLHKENIFYVKKDGKYQIKIGDFGLAHMFSPTKGVIFNKKGLNSTNVPDFKVLNYDTYVSLYGIFLQCQTPLLLSITQKLYRLPSRIEDYNLSWWSENKHRFKNINRRHFESLTKSFESVEKYNNGEMSEYDFNKYVLRGQTPFQILLVWTTFLIQMYERKENHRWRINMDIREMGDGPLPSQIMSEL